MNTRKKVAVVLVIALFVSVYMLIWSIGHDGSSRVTVAIQRATWTESVDSLTVLTIPTDTPLPADYPPPSTQVVGYPGPGSLSGAHTGPAFRVLLPVVMSGG